MDDPQPDMWVVTSPLIWQDAKYGRLVVPMGFRTDLASTPLHLGSTGVSRRPAAMHDWLYAERSRGKAWADLFLRDALLAEGASQFIAEEFYYGVHLAGDHAWASDEGALESRDFDTPEHYALWRATSDGEVTAS
ncbi:MAG TPA: DUF1353 domain-containing protein [Steroidobacteraceae bacterium]